MVTSLPDVQSVGEEYPGGQHSKPGNLRLLIVSDEAATVGSPMLQNLISPLASAGYQLYPICTSQDMLRNVQFQRPDVILVDQCLAASTGIWTIQYLRQKTIVPILVLSVRSDEFEKISCLDAGADDYVAKPFATSELLARLRAVLRRVVSITSSQAFSSGNLQIDFDSRQVLVGTLQVKLTATEYNLLKILAGHAGMVRTHRQLIHELWGATRERDALHLLRVTISNLRRKLPCEGGARSHITTELGVGYRLRSDSDRPAVEAGSRFAKTSEPNFSRTDGNRSPDGLTTTA